MSLIADLVEADSLPANPYRLISCCLLAVHHLTDIQRVEQLHQLPPLAMRAACRVATPLP
jgi:hypothetical protein